MTKGTAATAAMPARDLLMHMALEQKHILVQVGMLPEETFTVVHPSMSGQVRRRPIFVFSLGGSIARLVLLLANIPQTKMTRDVTSIKT